MPQFAKTSTAVFLTLLLSAGATFAAADDGLQSAMERFKTAFNRQDAAGVASVFLADGKLLAPGKPMLTGTEDIRAHWQGAFTAGVSRIEKTPIEILVDGDLAVETSRYVVDFKDKKILGKDTLVWRRGKDSVWRIASDIWNSDQ